MTAVSLLLVYLLCVQKVISYHVLELVPGRYVCRQWFFCNVLTAVSLLCPTNGLLLCLVSFLAYLFLFSSVLSLVLSCFLIAASVLFLDCCFPGIPWLQFSSCILVSAWCSLIAASSLIFLGYLSLSCCFPLLLSPWLSSVHDCHFPDDECMPLQWCSLAAISILSLGCLFRAVPWIPFVHCS